MPGLVGRLLCGFGRTRRRFVGVWSGLPGWPGIWGFLAYFGGDLLAAAAAGAFVGFIFGLPRTLDAESRTKLLDAVQKNDTVAASHAAMAANTNLERVSDWLTTLLIGATLVQIKDIVIWVGGIGKNLIDGRAPANDAVVPIIIVCYFALSFLGIYLITRLYVTYALSLTLDLLTARRQPASEPHHTSP